MTPWLKQIRQVYGPRKEYLKWRIHGKPLPPPHVVKQKAIRDHSHLFGLKILVESGTYLGEMVEAQRKHFRRIISIELSQSLFQNAKEKFQRYQHIEILHGDSGELIKGIVNKLNEPALFWLDGHFSGGTTAKARLETPILDELGAILTTSMDHVVLIDDARLFCGDHDYPTIKGLEEFIAGKRNDYNLTVRDDLIRLTKRFAG